MSHAARSLFLFGVYVVAVGVAFIVAPDPLVRLLALPAATVGWARVVGLMAIVIGAYDIAGSRAECMPYIRASIPVRFGFFAGTILLVLVGEMPVTVALVGAIDMAGAVWTGVALRSA